MIRDGEKQNFQQASSFSAAPYCNVNDSKFRFDNDNTDNANTKYGALVLPFGVFIKAGLKARFNLGA